MVCFVLHLQPELQVALLRAPGGLCAVDDRAVDAVVADEMLGVDDTVIPLWRCSLLHAAPGLSAAQVPALRVFGPYP